MSRLNLVLFAIVVSVGTGDAMGQLATVKAVSSSPLRMQSLGNRPSVETGKFKSILTLKDQSVHIKKHQQPDLEPEIRALQEAQKTVSPAPDSLDKPQIEVQEFPGTIFDANINILHPDKPVPADRSEVLFAGSPALPYSFSVSGLLVHWDAPQICYGRLYFEDPVLERYGQTCGNKHLDIIRSEGIFAMSTVMWPIRYTFDIPGKCETPFGYCRPGTPLPKMREHLITR